MLPYFTEQFGNAASRQHRLGWEAQRRGRAGARAGGGADRRRRARRSSSPAARPRRTTSRSRGCARAARRQRARSLRDGGRPSTSRCSTRASGSSTTGWRVTVLPVERDGLVDLDRARARGHRPTRRCVSVMAANNEIGVLAAADGRLRRSRTRKARCAHRRGAGASGKVPFDVEALGVDLASLTAHKLYGPKGVGALYVRRTKPRRSGSRALSTAAARSAGMRSGTLNVPGIVGFGAAAAIAARGDGRAKRSGWRAARSAAGSGCGRGRAA